MKTTQFLGKRLCFALAFVAALLTNAISVKAQSYSISGPEILNSSDWQKESGRWKEWNGGIYDYAGGSNLSNTELISPEMPISNYGQKITINGYNNGGSTSVLKVYYSNDKTNWTLAKDLSENMNATTGSAVDMSAELVIDGNYYIKLVCNKVFIISLKIEEYEAHLPEMTIYTNSSATTKATSGRTTDFGLVTEAPEYKFYVKNSKLGILSVEVTATEGFTVTPATMSLAAGEQQELTITTDGKGTKNGTVTITGKDGEDVISTFTASYKGEVMDKEGKFFEDFNGTSLTPVTNETLPGWEVDETTHEGAEGGYAGKLQYYDDNGTTVAFYYVTGDNDTAGYLITPKLHVSGTDDIMYFRANGLSSGGKFVVSYSSDKNTWSEATTEYLYSYSTKSFKNVPEGDYYFKIELSDATIDWIYGFTLAQDAETLELTETAASELTTGAKDITLHYTLKEGKWNTIALPFAVSDLSVFGDNVKAYSFTGYDNNELKFAKVAALEAGVPYLLWVETVNENNGNFTFNAADITATEAGKSEYNGAALVATYAPIAAGSMADTWYGVTPDGKIMKGGSKASLKGYRAYMTLPENVDASSLMMMFDDQVLGIKAIDGTDAENDAIYNISGQRVASTAMKGIYIVNGKKVIK